MKAKITLLIALFFILTTSFSQQIGDGFAPIITDFRIPLLSGGYNGYNPTGSAPDLSFPGGWQHLLVVRHPNPNNHHALQIASSMAENDRLFFRKIAGGLEPHDPQWNELATRGTNNFVGNQSISGNVGIGTLNPSNLQGWGKVLDVAGAHHSKILATAENALYKVGIFSHNQEWYGGGGFVGTESDHPLHLITNYNVKMSVLTNGNIGIGTTNPSNKLDVNGTIHSKEVKVDMSGWPDYVFKKEYYLPTLEEVEEHIAQKGHLENIPSQEEVLKNGISLGEMNAKLLQKIEELTLYMIEQEKKNKLQFQEIDLLKKENQKFQSLLQRVAKLENQSK